MTPSAPPPSPRRLRRWAVRLLVLFLVAFALLNLLAYRHAHAFTHYAPVADQSKPPEAMSTGDKLRAALTGVAVPRPVNFTDPGSVGLTFTSHALDLGGGESLSIWLVDHPAPRGVVVLGHGYASCKASLVHEAAGFHQLGFAAVLVDFRGSGDSTGAATTLGVAEAADLAAVARWTAGRHPGRPLVLYGFSMGAAAVVKAIAAHGLTPAAVVLEAPFDRLLNTVRGRFRAMGLPPWPGAELIVFWGGRQQGFDGFAHNPAADAAVVTCPALVLHGADDRRAPTEMARHVFEALSGAKTFVAVPGVGHQSIARTDRAAWDAVVGPFLTGVGRRPE